ncbi:unnamed protein product, partial [Rotaria magnacalcarata]
IGLFVSRQLLQFFRSALPALHYSIDDFLAHHLDNARRNLYLLLENNTS